MDLRVGSYDLAWLARPGVLILLAILAGRLLFPFWIEWRERGPITVAMTLFGFAFVWGVFEKALGVPFPPDRVFVWPGYDP